MEFSEMNVICRLCLQNLTENCESIEEIVHYTLNFLNLCSNFTISDDPMMCETCALNLKKCFDFKTRCLSTEDCIASFAEDEVKTVDLRDIYSKAKLNGNIDRVPDNHSVCRFCLELVKDDDSIPVRHDVELIAMLQEYFLEMDLRIMDDVLACTSCYDSLRFHVSFVNNYQSIEGTINEYCKIEGANYKDQIDLRDVATFTSKRALNIGNISSLIIKEEKQEDIVNTNVDVTVKFEGPTDVEEEKQKLVDNDIQQSNENSFLHQASPSQSDHVPQLIREKPAKHKCDLCDYETKRKSDVKRHMLTHKTPLEITMYKCNLCDYQAKRKSNLKEHMRTHKTHLDITMYRCDLCDYKGRRKSNLKIHMLTHKTPSEVTMYKCQVCIFETRRKDCLQRHTRVHMDVSEVEMHKCEMCHFETKWKKNLQAHMVCHRKIPEVVTQRTTYKCDLCNYKGNRKSNLTNHMLIHKTHLEITIHKCNLCDYEAKRKSNLNRHMLTH